MPAPVDESASCIGNVLPSGSPAPMCVTTADAGVSPRRIAGAERVGAVVEDAAPVVGLGVASTFGVVDDVVGAVVTCACGCAGFSSQCGFFLYSWARKNCHPNTTAIARTMPMTRRLLSIEKLPVVSCQLPA